MPQKEVGRDTGLSLFTEENDCDCLRSEPDDMTKFFLVRPVCWQLYGASLNTNCNFTPSCFVISVVRAVRVVRVVRAIVKDTESARPVGGRWSAMSSVCRLNTGRTSSHPQVSH